MTIKFNVNRFSPSGIWTPLVEEFINSSEDPEKAKKRGENSMVEYCFLLHVFNKNHLSEVGWF